MRAPALILMIAVFTLIGDYLLKLASEREQSFATLAFAAGIIVYGSTAIGWVLVMKHMPLASIGVWYSVVTMLLLTGLGVFAFGETLTLRDGAGLALAIAGLALMSRFA